MRLVDTAGSGRSPDLPLKKPKYKEGYHFITIVTNKRIEVFKCKDIAMIAVRTILFYEKRGDFRLIGFIVMPDHIHMICEPAGSDRSPDLSSIVRDIKKYIAKEAIGYLSSGDSNMLVSIQLPKPKKKGHTHQLWQTDFYAFNILTESKLKEKLRYMYENPVRKGLCNDIFDYEFSDIRRYFGAVDRKLP
ncbi:MAG: hypothetical protein A3G93_15715 [Nitrospinae bacterium RIFCSPLOWO2_12_FULL_45_22]|nr:MAG: hypothetical protein A3G93_15715 [Nitrospinae bacterium RIFCSPLOWO2_12_FULL_45_22]